jgi:hypothetical protein
MTSMSLLGSASGWWSVRPATWTAGAPARGRLDGGGRAAARRLAIRALVRRDRGDVLQVDRPSGAQLHRDEIVGVGDEDRRGTEDS